MRNSKSPKMSATKSSSKAKMTTGQKLAVISPRLRRGDIATIAQKTGFDASHVGRVLRGERTNPSGTIVNEAYKSIGRRKVNA